MSLSPVEDAERRWENARDAVVAMAREARMATKRWQEAVDEEIERHRLMIFERDSARTPPDVIDRIIGEMLQTFLGRAWSTADLYETLVMRPEIEISSLNLRGMMIRLRETDGTIASRCYNPDSKKWRWRD